MFNLRNVFQLVIDRFDDGSLTKQEFIGQRHEMIFHVLTDASAQLSWFLNINNRIKSFEFDAGIFGGEAPVNANLFGIAMLNPSIDLF